MLSFPWSSALLTGASSGIGRAMVCRLAAAGVPTVAVARRGDRLAELAATYPEVEPLVADLETSAGRAAVGARLTDPLRPVDLLVNNAGYGAGGRFADIALTRHRGQIELNVASLTELTHVALGPMVARSRGWVLNVSSVVSFQAAPSSATYGATKAYVTSLTEALSEELRGRGVKVTALCPGLTRTEFHEVYAPQGGSAAMADVPSSAWMTADAVAAAGLGAAAAGRVILVPGAANKALVAASALAPRALRRRIAGLVTRSRY